MSNTTPWCNRHNKPAHFSGSRGLTCGYPGQESCWIVKLEPEKKGRGK